ncbi:MAG: protein-export membrane protein SecD [Rhizobiales bacterium 65-9]|nr:protein translocase subunit SecD [Hyphomicrobiales bacterium]OJY37654.1 MAG: protein-export membrane protein SecD [Rhizobiales bacterium 65-9]
MFRTSPLKTAGVILLALASILFALPNLWTKETRDAIQRNVPAALLFFVPHKAMPLGLDLQGGAHLLFELDSQTIIRQQAEQLRNDVREIFRREGVALGGGIALQPRGVSFRVPDAAARARVMPRLRELIQPAGNPLLGAGGAPSYVLTEGDNGAIQIGITDAGVNERIGSMVGRSIEVIRRRIDPTGVTEPNIQRQGFDRVLVQVPGVSNAQEIIDLVGQTAELEFRFVAEPGVSSGETEVVPYPEGGPGATITVERNVIVKGDDLIDASASPDAQRGGWQINFKFNIKGARAFGDATTKGLYRRLAILLIDKKPGGVVEKRVVSAPTVQSPITGGQGQITGNFTAEQANNLAIQLRSGALPVALTVVEQRVVGPGLGQDSIDAGRKASYVAAVLVCLFMLASYGVFGIIANVALLVHVMLIIALMSLIGATLTLPGIAGIVLTIGTAVDANVLIYERIREEARLGRTIPSAIDAGFNRAFATIMDSNSTMAIAALILMIMGTGPVKGFAVVFILGILTTVVTAVTMTRMMIALWYRWARPKAMPF